MKARQCVFPRWRGFNLLGMFCSETSEYRDFRSPGYYTEEDFKMIADWVGLRYWYARRLVLPYS